MSKLTLIISIFLMTCQTLYSQPQWEFYLLQDFSQDSVFYATQQFNGQQRLKKIAARTHGALQRLDSVDRLDKSEKLSNRYIYHYNDKDQLIGRDSYSYGLLDTDVLKLFVENWERDDVGKLTYYDQKRFNKILEKYELKNYRNYSYYDDNRLKLRETGYYDSYKKEWKYSLRNYSYPDERTTIIDIQRKTDSQKEYTNNLRYSYYFNPKGKRDSTILHRWVDNDWEFYEKTEYSYEDGKVVEEFTHWYDIIEKSIRQSREIYRYESVKMVVENQVYDEENDVWFTRIKTEFDLDEYGNPVNEIYYSGWERLYMTGGPSMSEYSKNEYTYDYQFELKNLVSEGILIAHEIYDQVVHLPTEDRYFRKDTATNSWDLESVTMWHYSESILTSLDNQADNKILLYPNPFKDQVTINLTNNQEGRLQIYNLTGVKCFDHKVRSGKSIKLDLVTPGVYTYSLETDNRIHNGKIIKQ